MAHRPPLWDQFAALLPERPLYHPGHLLGCHRRRIDDRIVFDKLIQVLRFGCSYAAIADASCSATTIRNRPDEWLVAGVSARLKAIALDSYDHIVGLVLDDIAVDGCITKAPGGGEVAGPSPVDRHKAGYEALTDSPQWDPVALDQLAARKSSRSGSRRLHAGHHLASKQVPARLIPRSDKTQVSMSS